MYLTKLSLNPMSRRVRTEVMRPYQLHRTVMQAFPDNLDSHRERVLFRLDAGRNDPGLTLLVQSRGQPDWTFMDERGGYLVVPPESVRWTPRFTAGEKRYFRLRANPTVKRAGKRVPLLSTDEQEAWLTRKGAAGGFMVESLSLTPEGFIRDDSGQDHRSMSWYSTVFEGVLIVSDPGEFEDTLQSGVGPAKGLGFGMLSIVRYARE